MVNLKAIKTSTLAVDRFLNSNGGPQISPDGEQLAYISSRTGGAVVVIRDLKTGEDRDIKTQFRLSTRYSYGPMWFPDGRSVLVASGERGGISFYRVEVSTGTAELVHHVLWSVGYQLSPDGKAIFYTEQPPDAGVTRLVRFDLESRRETELKKGERFIAVAVSPDSRQLTYSVDVDPGGGLGYLGVMPASGGESREVFRSSRWAETNSGRWRISCPPRVRGGNRQSGAFGLIRALYANVRCQIRGPVLF